VHKEVFIVGKMEVDASKTAETEKILQELRLKTRLESGCIYYQLFKAEGKDNVFATIEHWESEAAERLHWEQPHLLEAGKKLSALLTSDMTLERFNRISNEKGCH
jgi:quinol monooxygenase YgiN